jgi:hypothetical protein
MQTEMSREKQVKGGGANQIGLKSMRAVPEPAQSESESQIQAVRHIFDLLELVTSWQAGS